MVAGIRANVPGLEIGVRLSAFDSCRSCPGADGTGDPQMPASQYTFAFGRSTDDDLDATLAESRELLALPRRSAIRWLCVTAGSPYYSPHVQRPALFPPSDGYEPPEDPLRGVARQIDATATSQSGVPDLVIVGSGYSYLQEWLPNVAQAAVRGGHGRLRRSRPDGAVVSGVAADVLAGRPLERKPICRTFSDCTTARGTGSSPAAIPLDPFYVAHPDAATLKALKEKKTSGVFLPNS